MSMLELRGHASAAVAGAGSAASNVSKEDICE